MNKDQSVRTRERQGERGAATFKFLLVVAVLGLMAYSGYQYIPVAYNASMFKDSMQESVDKASISPTSNKSDVVKNQLRASAKDYDLPDDATISVAQTGSSVTARVQYTRPIHFPGYTYEYQFDHTAKSTGMFNIK